MSTSAVRRSAVVMVAPALHRGTLNVGIGLNESRNYWYRTKAMSTEKPNGSFCRRLRREFLWQSAGGFGAVALSSMMSADGSWSKLAQAAEARSNPLSAKPPHFAPKAKSIIFLFMYV